MKTMLMTGATLLFAGSLGLGTAYAANSAKAVDAGPVIQNSQAMAGADQAGHPMNMRAQIQAQLTKDGYTDVTVMPSSFYVHAKNKAGNPVAMVIGPDSFTEVTDVMPKQAQNTTPATPAAPAAKTTQN